jgi:hypothetical protein
MSMSAPVTTAQEWDKVRKSFATSIMVDTSLHSLAQNLEGADWPIKSKEDTPAKYIDLSYEETVDMLALKGLPATALDQLTSIMRETLAFDQPFGEMVTQVESSSAKDNTLLKNLGRLGIPETFPIDFTALDSDTRDFCHMEKLNTLGEFAMFAQSMSQSVIVGGDFRTLLNALSQSDEATLSRFLPVRAGAKGIHLPEALALGLRKLPRPVFLALAEKAGARLSASQTQEAHNCSRQATAAAESELRLQSSRLVADLFKQQLAELQTQVWNGTPLDRFITPIGDPLVEAIVASQLSPYLQKKSETSARKPGFWARLFGRR